MKRDLASEQTLRHFLRLALAKLHYRLGKMEQASSYGKEIARWRMFEELLKEQSPDEKKILLLQLARLGDIYQTWPVLRALKRVNPDCRLDLLTRGTFANASRGLEVVDRHWVLDTRALMEPLIDEKPDLDSTAQSLFAFCDEVGSCDYDQIINLSFSPFSSYLTADLAGPTCEVRGYTRFTDGYLRIPDDGSAYFYAQVGIDRPNRVHVTDLFAHIAGVELQDQDWRAPILEALPDSLSGRYIAIHVGASTAEKTLSWSKWLQVVRRLLIEWPGEVVLLGSKEEIELSEKITVTVGSRSALNLVGKTTLNELMAIVGGASLLIGGDSAPVQIASLTGTKVLNISMATVSFWETGPRSKGSRILPINREEDISADEVVREALVVVSGGPAQFPAINVLGSGFPYLESRPQSRAFEWDLLRALYMGDAFPQAKEGPFLSAAKRMAETTELALEQIKAIKKNPTNKAASAILDCAGELMEHIAAQAPEISPIVRWFKTECLRIGPMPVDELADTTALIHERLGAIIELYCRAAAEGGENRDDVDLGL